MTSSVSTSPSLAARSRQESDIPSTPESVPASGLTATDNSSSHAIQTGQNSDESAADNTLPIGDGDEKINFPPDRPACLPDMYMCRSHPLYTHRGGRAFYYIQDGSPEGMKRTAIVEHSEMDVPSGDEANALRLGFLKLMPGDIVFSRMSTASSSGLDDVPVCWLNGSDLFSEELRTRVMEVRDRVLGPRNLRTRTAAVGRGANRTGGTQFERDFPPNDNVRDGRCYPFGTSYETIPKLYAPCAQARRANAPSEVVAYRSDLLAVTADMATQNILAGPKEVADGLRLNHELVNTPSAGVPGNAFFGANQLNLAPAERVDSDITLQSSLGSAGSAHIDPMDSSSHFTNMTCISDLPLGWDPGRFFVLYPGVFYELGDFVSLCFSGLRRHGGTPPLAPAEAAEDEMRWASRATVVSYPPTGSVSTNQRRVLCADGIGGYLTVTPEMIAPQHLGPADLKVNHSSFSSEGSSVMDRASLMKFMGRSLLQKDSFIMRQMPDALGVRIDTDAFLSSFSFVDETGLRQPLGAWKHGPGWRSCPGNTDTSSDYQSHFQTQQSYIQQQHEQWEEFHARYSGHIPYAVAVKPGIRTLEGWEDGNAHPKITWASLQKASKKKMTSSDSSVPELPDNQNRKRKRTGATPPDNSADPSENGETSQAEKTKRGRQDVPQSSDSHRGVNEPVNSADNSQRAEPTTDEENARRSVPNTRSVSRKGENQDSMDVDPSPRNTEKSPQLVSSESDDAMTFEEAMRLCEQDMENMAFKPDLGEDKDTFLACRQTFSSDGPSFEELTDMCEEYMKDIIDRTQSVMTMSSEEALVAGPSPQSTEELNDGNDVSMSSPVCNKQLPGYLSVISYEAVYAELFAVQTGAMELSRTQHVDANINPDKLVYNLENATRQAPFDPSIFTIIRDTKLGLDLLHVNEIQEYLKLKQARCCIMLSNRALWIWLEDKIPSYVSAILTGFYDGQECWLTYLVRDLSALLGEEYPLASFRPGEYGIPTVGLDAVTLDLEDYQQDPRDPSSFRTVVMKGVHDIVAAWLDYPTDGPSYWKAVYVDVIYKSVGVEPLVLDCVWHIYKMMSQKLMGHRKKTPLALDIDTAAYPLFDPESQIRRDLRQLATIVFAFAAGKHGIPDNAVLLGNTPAQHIENVADRRLMAFRVFNQDCYHYCFQGRPTRADGLDDLLDNNGDSYMPFREHGPTRQHMQKAGGPFSPENVRTVEGVFSAVVCRAITFNTEFSRHGRTLFTSPEDFFRAVEDYGCTKVEDYCNPGAYGQHNSRKKAELVSLYWNAINTGTEWPGLKATSPITFTECFEYFYPTSNLSRFPQIGKLGAYLLTADYVYAGIVQAPSSETVSTMIKKINKGPVSAFEVLGMVPQRTKSQHGNKHQTIVKSLSTMLETVHRVVQSSLPEDAHHHIDVDYILTEHALCKFARVVAGKNPVLRIGV